MAVIELGELRDDVEPDPPPRRPRAAGRPFRCALVLVLALATLAAAVPAPRRTSAIVPARSGAEAFLSGDRIYVVEPVTAELGGPRQLTAYPLPDRASARPVGSTPLWRAEVPDGGQYVSVFALGDVVVLTGPSTGVDFFRTIVFDAGTGRPLWRQPGIPVATTGGGLLLGQQGASVEHSVEPRSGRTRWSAPVSPDGVAFRFGVDGVDRMVSAANSGQVDVWDATTGAKLRSINVRPGELPTWQHSLVVDDLLLVVPSNATTVTAYGLDRLDRRWEARLSLVAYVASCGDLLCAYRQTGGVWALDASGDCRVDAGILLCRRLDGSFGLWRLDR